MPRTIAKSRQRLISDSFAKPLQRPDRQGPVAHFLSYVELSDAVDLLSVCGIPPEALAEPDTALLAARLRATSTGNRQFLRYQYDAILRNDLRREHEREAEELAAEWATTQGYYLLEGNVHRIPLSGFDLLAYRPSDKHVLEIEVKGYSASTLRSVRLQPSQARRAKDSAAGRGRAWTLFAVLNAGSQKREVKQLLAREVATLIDNGGIGVK
ncbi:MAG: hypothetical protein KDA95_03225 [Acidimicrobiales bacterium]|nr:hypothetical protein [Acidimicrobiales bacterium]